MPASITHTYYYMAVPISLECILSNGEVIKYHKFISVVVIEISARYLNTGPADRLGIIIYRLLIGCVTIITHYPLFTKFCGSVFGPCFVRQCVAFPKQSHLL